MIRKVAIKVGLAHEVSWTRAYEDYIKTIEPQLFYAPLADHEPTDSPLFSIVVPFFNTPDKYLRPLLDSISNQSFQDWELIMTDASTDESRASVIKEYSDADPRFTYVRLHSNGGISRNTNEGLRHARGRYVVFADHDDTCSLHALNEMAIVIHDDPDTDVLYSDEDVLTDNGRYRKGPFFKPSWSPHMFLEMNYTNHLSVIRRELIEQVGGLRRQCDGAQDYDLLLRIHTLPRNIVVHHIPKILYHWREAEHSTARAMSAKTYALDAGATALAEYLDRVDVENDGVGHVDHRPGWYHIHPRRRCSVQVIVSVSTDQRLNEHFANLVRNRTRATWVSATFTPRLSQEDLGEFCRASDHDVIVVIRSMFLPQSDDWLDELAGVLALPGTAGVAPLLMFNTNRRVVDAGLVNRADQLRPLYKGCRVDGGGPAGPPDLVRDVDGLTPFVVAFPRRTEHESLFLSQDIDGRGWSDRLVLWGHVRFLMAQIAGRDEALNDNLALEGRLVVLRSELDAGKRYK